jgi:hypothetical protein
MAGPQKSAWPFLNKTHDHRVNMLRKLAQAAGVEVVDLFAGEGK